MFNQTALSIGPLITFLMATYLKQQEEPTTVAAAIVAAPKTAAARTAVAKAATAVQPQEPVHPSRKHT